MLTPIDILKEQLESYKEDYKTALEKINSHKKMADIFYEQIEQYEAAIQVLEIGVK